MPAITNLPSASIRRQERLININLSGVFFGMRFAIPEIERAGVGAVVNEASILGSVSFANSTAYVSAMAFLARPRTQISNMLPVAYGAVR